MTKTTSLRTPLAGALLACALCLGGCASMARDAEMYDAPRVVSTAATPLDARQSRDRIVTGAQALGWAVSKEEPGLLELTYDKQGKHQVTVAVRYDPSGYKIDYLRSHNLNYVEQGSERRIHPNYNRWILNLVKRIGPV